MLGTVEFWLGFLIGMVGTVFMMTLISYDSYEKGYKDGRRLK